jgi:hypothetical protein
MSPFEITAETDDAAAIGRLDSDSTARRWSIPEPPRFPLPAVGVMIYAGIRLLGLVMTVFLLRHGKFRQRGVSLTQWITGGAGGDGGYYRAIAAHGYQYRPGQVTHAAVFSFFPGYPAAIDSLAWLPGVSIALAGFAVTVLAGMAAAWGLVALGLKLTADRRISLLMVAIWAVAPGSIALSRVHSEALFCALGVWTLVALLNRRWLTAGALVVLAGTVRSTALALIAAVAVAVLTVLIQAVRTRQRIALWWRPVAALLLAPLGLLGYWAYVALEMHRLDGWFWIEEHVFHMSSDWGVSTVRAIGHTFLNAPSAAGCAGRVGVPGGPGAHGMEPDRTCPPLPACLHGRGCLGGLYDQRQLDELQAALHASRRPARPPDGAAAGSAADFGPGSPPRRAHRRIDLVRPLPRDHRPVGVLR